MHLNKKAFSKESLSLHKSLLKSIIINKFKSVEEMNKINYFIDCLIGAITVYVDNEMTNHKRVLRISDEFRNYIPKDRITALPVIISLPADQEFLIEFIRSMISKIEELAQTFIDNGLDNNGLDNNGLCQKMVNYIQYIRIEPEYAIIYPSPVLPFTETPGQSIPHRTSPLSNTTDSD